MYVRICVTFDANLCGPVGNSYWPTTSQHKCMLWCTRAECYDVSMPATMLTVQHLKTIPNTKCTKECQHNIGTYAWSFSWHVNSKFQHKERPGITKPSSIRKAKSRLLPTWKMQPRLSPPPDAQPKL